MESNETSFEELLAKLTPTQIEYLEALPANNWKPWTTQKAVGIGTRTLQSWLRDPKFVKARDAYLQGHLEAVGATYERVCIELARIAFSDPRSLFDEKGNLKPIGEWDADSAAAISGMDVEQRREGSGEDAEYFTVHKPRFYNKNDALKTLATLHGKLIERHEHTGAGGAPIEINDTTRRDAIRRMLFLLRQAEADAQSSPPESPGTSTST